MTEVSAEYGSKIKECEDILATIPASAMKLKAASVQHLLASNADLIVEIRAIQLSTDKEKLRCLPELVHQLEQNLLEVIRVYKDL